MWAERLWRRLLRREEVVGVAVLGELACARGDARDDSQSQGERSVRVNLFEQSRLYDTYMLRTVRVIMTILFARSQS